MENIVNFILPKGWNELSQRQLLFVYELLSMDMAAAEIKVHCLMKWNKIKVRAHEGKKFVCSMNRREFVISSDQMFDAVSELDWIDAVPAAPVRLERIHGAAALPADFSGVTFEKFLYLDNLYQGYLSTKKNELLDDMGKIMYGWKNKTVKLSYAERISVFYWFASLKGLFARQFTHFFQPAGDHVSLNSQYRALMDAMNAQIRALTKGDVTKEKEVLELDTWRALTELDAQARDYEDMNRKS